MSEQRQSAQVYLAVHRTEGRAGNLMYVIIDDRSVFDLIDLPEGGNGKVRTKAVDHGDQYIIFQHWLTGSELRENTPEPKANSQELKAGPQ